jgi:hypothetical protein
VIEEFGQRSQDLVSKIDVDELRDAAGVTGSHTIEEKHDNPKYLKRKCDQSVIPTQ